MLMINNDKGNLKSLGFAGISVVIRDIQGGHLGCILLQFGNFIFNSFTFFLVKIKLLGIIFLIINFLNLIIAQFFFNYFQFSFHF